MPEIGVRGFELRRLKRWALLAKAFRLESERGSNLGDCAVVLKRRI